MEDRPVIDPGALTSGLLTGLREGVEAALIVAIVLAYLAKTGNRRHFDKIGLGVGSAIALSLVLGVALFVTIGELPEPFDQLFEGGAMLLAASVVTWMLFWMRRQAASVKGALQQAVDRVLTEGTAWGLTVLAFTAVIREGIETSLFLVGQATALGQGAAGGPASLFLGAVVGLAISVALGFGFYRGSRRLNLQVFFRWTGVALIFIAAGLLSQAVHEFIEIGVIGVGTQTAYDLSAVLPHEPIDGGPAGLVLVLGQFLRAILGYSSTPEVATVGVHVAYLAVVLALYLRPIRPAPRPTEERTAEAA